jgi:O-acetyl-ADP-ribose deacetylase (regulator of RNase III)
LNVDAIVNAANGELLGCFKPEHRCIDNVIHAAAGPRLRQSCYSLKRPVPAGTAVLTPAFGSLPCKHVVHVVGPQIRGGSQPSAAQINELVKCYQNSLREAEAVR